MEPEEADITAFKALAAGTASAGQQQRVLRFVLNVSGLRDIPQAQIAPEVRAFNDGRRFVGWHVARLVELVGVTADLSLEAPAS